MTAPMLHWPDSMATYIKEDSLLFSNDLFGQHFASSFRFDEGHQTLLDMNPIFDGEAASITANMFIAIWIAYSKKIEG